MKGKYLYLIITILTILILFNCKADPIVQDNDGDGIEDSIDNCIEIHNPDQKDTDGDGIGDVCDPDNNDGPLGDRDEDGVYNKDDNCPDVYNPGQDDDDNDGVGNLCDSDWVDPSGDLDGDGVINSIDNCPDVNNPDQADGDGDNVGDSCDSNLQDGPTGDIDGDGIPNNADSCPNDYNKGIDYDNDGIDDACDPPPPEYTLTFGLYDDFDGMGCEQTYDGSQMAVDGSLSSAIWRHLASEDVSVVPLSSIGQYSISDGSNPSGNVIRLLDSDPGYMHLEIINPEKINFIDYGSFSADMMLKDTNLTEIGCALDFHTSIPEQGGISWYTQMGIMKDPRAGFTYIFAQVKNKNNDYHFWGNLVEAKTNTWYNIRMDIIVKNDTELEIQFYVNNELKATEIPPDSEILLDPSRLAFGPIRNLGASGPDKSIQNPAIAYLDNFMAVYKNRIQ